MIARDETSQIIAQASCGDTGAAARLFPLVYEELRELAHRQVGQGVSSSLEPTAIVHEVFLRLVDHDTVDFNGRTHFYAIAATAMRQIVVDQVRRQQRLKRGGDWQRLTLSDSLAVSNGAPLDAAALDDALRRFAALDERAAKVVELRFFGGMTELEIATALQVSERTVRNDWLMARAWLRCVLSEPREADGA